MKKLANLKRSKSLSKKEQKDILGGGGCFTICTDGTEVEGLANCDIAPDTICQAYGGSWTVCVCNSINYL